MGKHHSTLGTWNHGYEAAAEPGRVWRLTSRRLSAAPPASGLGLSRVALSWSLDPQNDGRLHLQVGADHERGEQHRGRQRAHHAFLLQAVWHCPGGPAPGLLLLDDTPVLHVLGEVGQPEQEEDLCWPGVPRLRQGREDAGGDQHDWADAGILHYLLCRDR